MVIHESAEDYLESILILQERRGYVRSIDVVNELGFSKPSVSIAMKNLREKNHITVTDAGFIYLTDSGKEIADRIYERHTLITRFFEHIGVDPQIAEDDACRIEHVISAETFIALKKFLHSNNID